MIPLYFNPNTQEHKIIFGECGNPMTHNDLIKCIFMFSNSGGLQEELGYFNKKIIVWYILNVRTVMVKTWENNYVLQNKNSFISNYV